MLVGILGAYNAGFLCDDLLYIALSNAIKRIKPGWEAFTFPYDRASVADCYIIGGGTILGNPLATLPIDKPFAVFGAGYRGAENIDKLKYALSVKVRGLYSVNKLALHGIKAEPCGDVIKLLPIPVVDRTVTKGLVPRATGWVNKSEHYRQWLLNTKPEIVINMNLKENDAEIMQGYRVLLPQTPEQALTYILSCKKLASSRLHPYLIALRAGIPCEFYEIEFNKGEDAVSGIPYWADQFDSLRETLDILENKCFELAEGKCRK